MPPGVTASRRRWMSRPRAWRERTDWVPVDTPRGRMLRYLRWTAIAVFLVVLVLNWRAYGVPIGRSDLLFWIAIGLACASIGRHPVWLLWVVIDFLPFAAVLIAYDYLRGVADTVGMPDVVDATDPRRQVPVLRPCADGVVAGASQAPALRRGAVVRPGRLRHLLLLLLPAVRHGRMAVAAEPEGLLPVDAALRGAVVPQLLALRAHPDRTALGRRPLHRRRGCGSPQQPVVHVRRRRRGGRSARSLHRGPARRRPVGRADRRRQLLEAAHRRGTHDLERGRRFLQQGGSGARPCTSAPRCCSASSCGTGWPGGGGPC